MTMAQPSFTSTVHRESYPAIDPTRSELSAAGKVILISGGGKGIGGAITNSFARAGAKDIIITGRDRDALEACRAKIEKMSKSRVHIFVGDVRDEKATKEMFATIRNDIGLIDVLVSNAGYMPRPGPVKDTSIDDFWRAFEINVKGATTLVQGFLTAAAEDAVLIDINAGLAHITIPNFPVAPYAASKVAFARVLDFVRQENPKLRVYSIHPGLIKTGMTAGDNIDFSKITWDDEALPGDFSIWLASHEADFLNGRFFWAQWDVEEMKEKKPQLEADPTLLTYGLGGWPFGQQLALND